VPVLSGGGTGAPPGLPACACGSGSRASSCASGRWAGTGVSPSNLLGGASTGRLLSSVAIAVGVEPKPRPDGMAPGEVARRDALRGRASLRARRPARNAPFGTSGSGTRADFPGFSPCRLASVADRFRTSPPFGAVWPLGVFTSPALRRERRSAPSGRLVVRETGYDGIGSTYPHLWTLLWETPLSTKPGTCGQPPRPWFGPDSPRRAGRRGSKAFGQLSYMMTNLSWLYRVVWPGTRS